MTPNPSPKSPYSVLGVASDASKDEIRTAYRKLAREHHPDVNPDNPAAEERFKEISAAYGVLSDDDKRARYDEFGAAGLQEGFDPNQARAYQRWSHGAPGNPFQRSSRSDIDVEDMFSSLFGSGAARGPRRGADTRGEVQIDFLDAVRGGEVSVQFEGKGALKIRIPRGADDGTKIRLAGQGQPGVADGPPGDLFLTLRVRPHRFFERSGDDLEIEVPTTLPELVLGASIEIPTPEGPVSMTVPANSQNGRKLRLRGRGVHRLGTSERGDLYVRLVLSLPKAAPEKLAELAREMAPLYEGERLRADLERTD